jgi:transcription antitermination factor NusG
MQGHNDTSIDHQENDKVRIKSGDYKGQKGVIQAIASNELVLKLENGAVLNVNPNEVTNQSLAARKAWQTMRKQQVT